MGLPSRAVCGTRASAVCIGHCCRRKAIPDQQQSSASPGCLAREPSKGEAKSLAGWSDASPRVDLSRWGRGGRAMSGGSIAHIPSECFGLRIIVADQEATRGWASLWLARSWWPWAIRSSSQRHRGRMCTRVLMAKLPLLRWIRQEAAALAVPASRRAPDQAAGDPACSGLDGSPSVRSGWRSHA